MTIHTPDECRKCKASAQLVQEKTRNFAEQLFKSLENTHAHQHLSAQEIMLIAIDSLFTVVGVAEDLAVQETVENFNGTKQELMATIDCMKKNVIDASFCILEANLAIKISAQSAVDEGDVSKVMSFIKGLKATKNGSEH